MDIGVYCIHSMAALFGCPLKVVSSSLKLSNGVPEQEQFYLIIREIPNPQTVTIYYRNGESDSLNIPKAENNMSYEVEEFIRLIKKMGLTDINK